MWFWACFVQHLAYRNLFSTVTNQSKDAVFLGNQVVHNPAKPIVLFAASFSRA